jgi:hypothetical protein
VIGTRFFVAWYNFDFVLVLFLFSCLNHRVYLYVVFNDHPSLMLGSTCTVGMILPVKFVTIDKW